MKTNEQILDEALQQGKRQQEESLIIDFDEAVEAQKNKAIFIRYGLRVPQWVYNACKFIGWSFLIEKCHKYYKVPSETPQWYMNIVNRKLHEVKSLDFSSLSEEELIERMEVSDKENERIFRKLFGDEFVEKYLEDNFVSYKTLNDELLNPILVRWGWKPVDSKKKVKLAS